MALLQIAYDFSIWILGGHNSAYCRNYLLSNSKYFIGGFSELVLQDKEFRDKGSVWGDLDMALCELEQLEKAAIE